MSASQETNRPELGSDPTLGALVHDLSQQMSTLVRDEMRLAQAEMTQKGKRAGVGIGMFGGAGLVALYGVATLLATIILAMALAMPAWLAALIVTVAYAAGAAALAVSGKQKVQAISPVPEQTIETLKEDARWAKTQLGSGSR